jgi:hypothetical protein
VRWIGEAATEPKESAAGLTQRGVPGEWRDPWNETDPTEEARAELARFREPLRTCRRPDTCQVAPDEGDTCQNPDVKTAPEANPESR